MKSNSLFSRTVVRLLAGIAITGGVVALAAVTYRQFFKPADTPQVERLAVVKDKPVASIKEAKPAVEAPTPEPSATPTPEPERKHPSAETTVDDLRGKKFTDKEEIFEALPSMVDGEKRELESERDGKRGKKEERRERKLGLNDRYKFIGSIPRLIPQSIKDLPARVDKAPREHRLSKAGRSYNGDLRSLPKGKIVRKDRIERGEPTVARTTLEGILNPPTVPGFATDLTSTSPQAAAPAPSPTANFAGLDFQNWGSGRPPDTVGDVGPDYYIQAVNAAVGIYNKSDGTRVAAFTLNTFMSQGHFGNLCDTDNFGDPVVLYDTFEDRWVITDFAFKLDSGGNVNPPTSFQCFAVSKSGDPVNGGWNFYSIQINDGLNDYPKFGIWPDGIYMSANMFGFNSGGSFRGVRVWALNKKQMYAGSPSIQVVSFDAPKAEFTLLPSNARLQTGTPPVGAPNYFAVVWQYLNTVSFYKFHVDWTRLSQSTFTGPFNSLTATSWPNANVPNAATTANSNDVLQIRLMMQNQYTNIGGVESLWNTHTTRYLTTAGLAAPRYYQTVLTGGTPDANTLQAASWQPDATARYIPSIAVDRVGNMAMGYSVSSSTLNPALRYAGRLATDPINTFSQTETSLFEGGGSQNTTNRWGDYSAMSVAPDGCTFWFTSEYYATTGNNWQTRIGSFSFPGCTTIGSGTLAGTVKASPSGTPIYGATVLLGNRSTTTDSSGNYQFLGLPAGTYTVETASSLGFNTGTANTIVVNEAATTTQDFNLTSSLQSACLTDTLQADFQTGLFTNLDVTTTPDSVLLDKTPAINQQNTTLGTSGVGVTTTTWGGQTFTPSVTGKLSQVDLNLFCSGCTGTIPNLTLSLRATASGLPTGADLATATITGFNSGASSFYTATFSTPPTLTAGTQYALLIRPTANPSPGTYALTRSGTATAGSDVYAGGTRISGATSGTVWSIPLTGGVSTDAGFKIYIDTGYRTPGTFTSGVKDSNPAPGNYTKWTTLSWNASIPASSSLKFQAAASNDPNGPFNFVGPDGTNATFFSSGDSLAQFNNLRYLKYQATFATTDGTMSPSLDDVTVCYENVIPTATVSGSNSYCGSGLANVSVTVNGGRAPYTVALTNGGGTATGTGPNFVFNIPVSSTTTFALDAANSHDADNVPLTAAGSAVITINPLPKDFALNGGGGYCAGGPGVGIVLAGSELGVNYQLLVGATPVGTSKPGTGSSISFGPQTTAGVYSVLATNATTSCFVTMSTTQTVSINPLPTQFSVTGGGTYCSGGTPVAVGLSGSEIGVNYQLLLGGSPVGSTVPGSGMPISFGNQSTAGTYTVSATNASTLCPANMMGTAVVTVNAAPVVTLDPLDQSVNPPGNASFSAAASGTPTPTVQWQVSIDGGMSFVDISGNPTAGTNNLTVMGVTSSMNGYKYRASFSNSCGSNVYSKASTLSTCVSPQVTTQPVAMTALQGGSVTFTSAASGTPTPSVQWEVSTDNGITFANVPGATSTSLTINPVTSAMNNNRYRAVFTNSCGSDKSQAAALTVDSFSAKFDDPLVCLGPGDLVEGSANFKNNGQVNGTFAYDVAGLAPNVIGIPGSGIAIDPATNQPIGTITVTATTVHWDGTLIPNQSVNITYKALLGANVQLGQTVCVNVTPTINNVAGQVQQICTTVNCPAGGVKVLVSDQKAGSVLMFPYYTSGNGADTRLTLTNTSNLVATPQNPNYTYVHLMFIDGATCQQADQYVCLTPNASLTIKTSEYDPGATGWVLAVAVDANGIPIKNNVLIGNAFVSDGTYQDNYGAETFAANNAPLAAVVGGQATLFFDGQSYDAVPKAFSVEVQSPVDVTGQKIVTVGLKGVVGSAMTGALQVGTGLVINGKESPVSSFANFLAGGCQATGVISSSSPRVTLGMSKVIPSGQGGTINFNTGPAVGVFMTPKGSKFGGIRTLHKTVLTTTTITIPVFVPSC